VVSLQRSEAIGFALSRRKQGSSPLGSASDINKLETPSPAASYFVRKIYGIHVLGLGEIEQALGFDKPNDKLRDSVDFSVHAVEPHELMRQDNAERFTVRSLPDDLLFGLRLEFGRCLPQVVVEEKQPGLEINVGALPSRASKVLYGSM